MLLALGLDDCLLLEWSLDNSGLGTLCKSVLARHFDAFDAAIGLDAKVEEDVCRANSNVHRAQFVPMFFVHNQVCEAVKQVEERDGRDFVVYLDFVEKDGLHWPAIDQYSCHCI